VVRLAKHGDEDALIALSVECYNEMDFDSFGYKIDPVVGRRNYVRGIDNPAIVIAVYDDGAVLGLMVSMIRDASQYFDDHRHAQEIVFHAKPTLNARQKFHVMNSLCKFTEDELRKRGVKSFYIGTDLRCKGVAHLLEREGYRPMTLHFYKEIQP
jgi:fructose-1,6-bisphosphatase/inositol monophosphatase family enzyme